MATGRIKFFNTVEDTLRFADIHMDYIAFGQGSKPLVMIQGLNTHGIRGTGFWLAFMYRMFAKDYRVYLFDRRSVVRKGITVREMASDLARAMDAMQISKADVLGVSQGGMIAQYLAIDRPDLVNSLVLAVTLSRNNPTVTTVIENWIALAKLGDMKRLVADMAEKMYSKRYLKKYRWMIPLLTILQKPKDIERFSILARSCLTCNAYDELDKIQCPALVIGGQCDLVTGHGASEEIAQKLGCEIHLYANLGHAAYEEAADFNQRIYRFFQPHQE